MNQTGNTVNVEENPNVNSSSNSTLQKIPITTSIPKDNKIQIFFKKFVSTRRRKLATFAGLLIFFVLFTGVVIAYFVYKQDVIDPQKYINPDLKVSSEGKSVLDKFDIIYIDNNNQIVAVSENGKSQVKVTSVMNGRVTDFKISPNKNKIAYLVADDNYKEIVKSPGLDIAKFRFDPVPTKLFEFDLYTGQNKLIWSTNSLNLISTSNQEYFPVSYVTEYYNNLSYPVSYLRAVPINIPNELYNDLPLDVYYDLHNKIPRIIAYNDIGDTLVFYSNGQLYLSDSNYLSKFKDYKLNNSGNAYSICTPTNGIWKGNILMISKGCYESASYEIFNYKSGSFTEMNLDGVDFHSYAGDIVQPIAITENKIITDSFNINGMSNGELNTSHALEIRKISDLNSYTSVSLPDNVFIATSNQGNMISSDNEFYFVTQSITDKNRELTLRKLVIDKNRLENQGAIAVTKNLEYVSVESFNKDFNKIILSITSQEDNSRINSFGIYNVTEKKFTEIIKDLEKSTYIRGIQFKVGWLK